MTSFSIAKSSVSALIGFAIADGYITIEEEHITDYIPELIDKDARFADITIRHLLTMSSGIRYEKGGLPWGDDMMTYHALDMRKSAHQLRSNGNQGRYFITTTTTHYCWA